ncbi:TPA: autotransporter outer membrane beta-barrel domain-containing protein, partial [Neisseria meningitidis]
EIGGDADFSFSDKPANGVSHYFSSGKTDPNSSEALYDEINITGKNYNSGILAVDNMPVVKKYVTENYGADLKQAVKDQLKDLYKTRPEDWEKNKKIVEEAIIKQYGIPRNKINKFRKVIDPIIEEA